MKLFKRLKVNQQGQALPIVLCLLAVGGLTIAASLNFSTNTLNGTGIVKQNFDGIYAAGAGIEYNLWAIKTGNATVTQLPQQVNNLAVNISTYVSSSFSTLYINNLASGGHSEWYQVTMNITAAGGNTYDVTIKVTTGDDAKNNAKLQELGAVLPLGYTYVNNSASVNPSGNITSSNPTSTGYDSQGDQWIKWTWSGSGPSLEEEQVYTEKFQITGTGGTDGAYAWIVGNSQDIGVVGQISGMPTTINATAIRTRDGKIIARIYAQALVGSGGVYILSWRVTN
ncbi:MAG: hypothetical protein Q7J73_00115 [Dehalococcoidales bacterium]|nr:hypothetical protein [Dehalococcoidales bacterium]